MTEVSVNIHIYNETTEVYIYIHIYIYDINNGIIFITWGTCEGSNDNKKRLTIKNSPRNS